MQTISHTIVTERDRALFLPLPHSTLGGRLARAIAEAAREIVRGPLSYLRAAFLPGRDAMLAGFINPSAQPSLAFAANVISPGEKGAKRRNLFMPVLAVSASLHAIFIGYLVYLTINNMLAPFVNFSVVNKDYRQYETTMVGSLYNPARPPNPTAREAMSLEEIRERDNKRREEAERLKREKEERERAEKERAEKEKAEREKEAQQKAEDAKKNEAGPSVDELKKIEINERPLKEIIGGVYGKYKAGGIDLEVMNFTIEAKFKIAPDGSLSGVEITKSSGSKIIDESGKALLHAISESHALQIFSSLSSGTIRFELTQNTARLTVTAFAASPSEAQKYADALGAVVFFSKLKPDLAPETKELLSLLKVKTSDQRINAEMTTTRARATEMMHARFDKPAQ